ncbi:MAG: hypothetical protein R3275_08935 [Saprospiraceae bacterium]|nr:hypothetical protein [Saprospiraceae bacterium]
MYKNNKFIVVSVTAVMFGLLLQKMLRVDFPICKNECDETYTVHFIHGSKVNPQCTLSGDRLGGTFGGHVEIEIDSFVYGFQFDDITNYHFIPQENFNCKFSRTPLCKWLDENNQERMSSFVIPAKSTILTNLRNRYESQFLNPKYDYAVLGYRCTSSFLKEMLEAHGADYCDLRIFMNALYPRQLRSRLLRLHNNENVSIGYYFQKGDTCREWE